MKPATIESQNQHKFAIKEQIVQNDPMPFFKKYMNRLTFFSVVFYIILIIFTGLFAFSIFNGNTTGLFAIAPFLVFLIFLPIHELIHAIAYKLYGAKNIGFKIVWKKLVIYTYADKAVVNSKQMKIIAAAPFAILSIIFLIFAVLVQNSELTALGGFAGLLHALLCGGDLAILNYLQINKDKKIYTYDDQSAGVSYFFEEIQSK